MEMAREEKLATTMVMMAWRVVVRVVMGSGVG